MSDRLRKDSKLDPDVQDQREMSLPHCVFQSDQDVAELLQTLRNQPDKEVDVAVSKSFDNWPPDWDSIYKAWEEKYRQVQAAATGVLGSPEFDGRWKDLDYPGGDILHEYLSAHLLTVWGQSDDVTYLRFGYEDKELPFVIALGTKRSRGDAYSYPGQFDEEPIEPAPVPVVDPSRIAFVTLVGSRVFFDRAEYSLDDCIAELMNRREDFDTVEFHFPLLDEFVDGTIELNQRVRGLPFEVSMSSEPGGSKAARFATVLVIQDCASFGDEDLSVPDVVEALRTQADQFDVVVVTLFPSPDSNPREVIDAGLKDTGLEVIYVLPPEESGSKPIGAKRD